MKALDGALMYIALHSSCMRWEEVAMVMLVARYIEEGSQRGSLTIVRADSLSVRSLFSPF